MLVLFLPYTTATANGEPPPAPVVTTTSTLTIGASGATVVLTSTDFNTAAALTDFTIDPDSTGLTATEVAMTSTTATFTFTGTITAGTLSIIAKTTAFDPITAANADAVTITSSSSGGGGGGGSPAPSAPSAPALENQSAITLTSSVTTIEFGGSFTVLAKGGQSTGGIKYSSSGNALCAIDASGNVTAVGKGTCTITATRAGDATYSSATSNSVTVTVTDNVVPGGLPTTEPSFVPTMSVAKPVNGVTTARIKIDTFYAGDRVSVLLGKKVGSKTTYRTLGSATVSATGQVTYKSKVALSKGSILRLKIGSEVIFSRTIN